MALTRLGRSLQNFIKCGIGIVINGSGIRQVCVSNWQSRVQTCAFWRPHFGTRGPGEASSRPASTNTAFLVGLEPDFIPPPARSLFRVGYKTLVHLHPEPSEPKEDGEGSRWGLFHDSSATLSELSYHRECERKRPSTTTTNTKCARLKVGVAQQAVSYVVTCARLDEGDKPPTNLFLLS